MIRITLLLLLTATLASCGSIPKSLPKCDGYSRRPLNRAMWQWEDKEKLQKPADENSRHPTSHAVPYAEEPTFMTPIAFAAFDVAGSSRPCEGR